MTPPQPTVDELKQGFTPGPWHYLDIGEIVPSDADGYPHDTMRICFMATPGSDDGATERIEANARLIAAAPALYAEHDIRVSDLHMLRKAIVAGDPQAELLCRIDDMMRETRALLALARGEVR